MVPPILVPETRPTETQTPDWVKRTLEELGLIWPEGDVVKLFSAGDAWIAFATSLRDIRSNERTGADRTAAQVWANNHGQPIDDFRQWWLWRRGPSANLAAAAVAADAIGASLKGMSVQVALLKAAFIANVFALAAAAVALGIAIVGSGGLAAAVVAAGGGFLVNRVKRRVQLAAQAALASVTAYLVGVLLRRAAENLEPAPVETMPRRDRQRDPREDPRPIPFPFPPPDPSPRENRRQRCAVQPGYTTPSIFGIPPNSADRRVEGGGLHQITRRVHADGSREVIIDGVVRDPIPRSNLERDLRPLPESIRIPAGQYHLAHTWGAGLGSEAAAGIYLAPAQANLVYHGGVESWLRGIHDSVKPEGWVELRTVTTTHPTGAWQNAGANLMASTTYEATVCYPGGAIQTYPAVTVNIDPPTNRNGVFRPGRVWTEAN
ncbi:MAG TPA: hypothetical protein VFC19_53415 [Candidatus Limnocylindrales bacterium]|nr:hypothetical protein [Candidatus Limnocylindrales bacterium]